MRAVKWMILPAVLLLCVGLAACGDGRTARESEVAVTLPFPMQPESVGHTESTGEAGKPESGREAGGPESGGYDGPVESGVSGPSGGDGGPAETAQAEAGPVEPVSGKYCVLGVYGRTYPAYTALNFDFENNKFNFGLPTLDSSWIRRGELKVEGSRITAVCNRQKSDFVGDKLVLLGSFTWIFELEPDGSLRFIPEGSDEFQVYGTHLDADSVLLRVGDLDKPLD